MVLPKRPAKRPGKRGLTTSYNDFKESHLKVFLLSDDAAVRKAAQAIKEMNPSVISLDIETASKNGRWGALNGSIRLIQLGFDEPDRGIEPHQILVDCHNADPKPILRFLESGEVEKQIHHMNFEEEWSRVHLGISIGNIYDTCLAWRIIQKRLKEMDSKEIEEIVPGYEIHDNKLSTLVDRYLHMAIPKNEQSGDWGRSDLSPDQIVYASMDVATLPPLVKYTKQIAERIGVSDDVDIAIANAKNSVAGRVQRQKITDNDDMDRVARAFERVQSLDELINVRRHANQMSISAENGRLLKDLFKQRRESLSAN